MHFKWTSQSTDDPQNGAIAISINEKSCDHHQLQKKHNYWEHCDGIFDPSYIFYKMYEHVLM